MIQFKFYKLVRNKLPTMYDELQQKIVARKLSGVELATALREKLIEEASEIPVESKDKQEIIDEISDVEQVLDDLKAALAISSEEVNSAKKRKFMKKGGFSEGVFVETIELRDDDEWVKYYRTEPSKYPEVMKNDTSDKKQIGQAPNMLNGIYRHYKGGVYEVLGVACNSETLQWYVMYQSQERKAQGLSSIWIRPYDMFTEKVEIDEELQPRFQKVDKQ